MRNAASDKNPAQTQHDILRCHVDRLQAGRAEAIDGNAASCLWQAREGANESRQVHALLSLGECAAKNNIFDQRTIKLRHTLNGCLDGYGSQVIGSYIFEYAFVGPPDRRAYRTYNNGFFHILFLLFAVKHPTQSHG